MNSTISVSSKEESINPMIIIEDKPDAP
jgi:hypothetical protein